MGSKRVLGSDVHPQAWGTHYEAIYASKSEVSSRARMRRRTRKISSGPAPTGPELVLSDIVRAQQASKRLLVDRRLTDGFEWNGGAIAGNPEYYRDPFRFTGLLSDQHPILKLFVSKLPRAKHLRVGDSKADSGSSDSKLLALDAAYVEANKIACGVLRIEVDSTLAWEALSEGCVKAGIPLPNIAVGHENAEGCVLRPHLIWLLHNSGPLIGSSPGTKAFKGLYSGVVRGLTYALLSVGADPGGLWNMHRHKNPISPQWSRKILAEVPYQLAELAAAVDTRVSMATLDEAARSMRQEARGFVPDHPDPEVAGESNAMFKHVATWARIEVARLRTAGASEDEFRTLVAEEACRAACLLTGNAAATERCARQLAVKVSYWTWHVYRIPLARTAGLSGDRLRERLIAGQAIAAASRKAQTRATIEAAITRLVKEGRQVTQVAVAALVKPAGVTGMRTIRRHWDLAGLYTSRRNRPSAVTHVKKEQFCLPLPDGPQSSVRTRPDTPSTRVGTGATPCYSLSIMRTPPSSAWRPAPVRNGSRANRGNGRSPQPLLQAHASAAAVLGDEHGTCCFQRPLYGRSVRARGGDLTLDRLGSFDR